VLYYGIIRRILYFYLAVLVSEPLKEIRLFSRLGPFVLIRNTITCFQDFIVLISGGARPLFIMP